MITANDCTKGNLLPITPFHQGTPSDPKRWLHISHKDLDGYGCTILSEYLITLFPYQGYELEIRNILPNHLTGVVKEVLEELSRYELVFITDLAINPTVAALICALPDVDREKFQIFDHHETLATDLPDNFHIAFESPFPQKKGMGTCATEMYYHYWKTQSCIFPINCTDPFKRHNIDHFVDAVRFYDTFEFWKLRHEEEFDTYLAATDAPRLNMLFHVYDRQNFRDYILSYLRGDIEWMYLTVSSPDNPHISMILELEEAKQDRYIISALKRMNVVPFHYKFYREGTVHEFSYTCGVIFAEKNGPIIGNTACEDHEELDFCAVVSNNQVSMYTIKPEINLTKLARILGGGGHRDAAGFTIPYQNASIFAINHFYDIVQCAGRCGPEE